MKIFIPCMVAIFKTEISKLVDEEAFINFEIIISELRRIILSNPKEMT